MKTICLPDLHFPFWDKKRLEEVSKFNKHYKADIVVQQGDLFDLYTLSRFLKDLRGPKQHEEVQACREPLRWLYRQFPQMRRLLGNHEERLAKYALEHGLDKVWLRELDDVMGVPIAWEKPVDVFIIDGVRYTHGHLSKAPAHIDFYNESVVIGHLHSELGITYKARNEKSLFSLCVGVIADKDAIAFRYSQKELNRWTQGFGGVDNGKPWVISLN